MSDIKRYIREILAERRYDAEEEDVPHGLTFSEVRRWISQHMKNAKVTLTTSEPDWARSTPQDSGGLKPKGLWYGCGPGWLRFAEVELDRDPAVGSQIWSISIDMSKMYPIDDRKRFDHFWNMYHNSPESMPEIIRSIDWKRVSRFHAGVEACPYPVIDLDSSDGFDHLWYYSFDVPSGCVWDSSAISSKRLVAERKDDGWEIYI
jgi:hypothetical protein